jgi:dTDP-4-amino-4,6-dideoxygalactose transaminase
LSRSDFLSFSPPFLGEEEIDAAAAALRSGWISRGPRTGEFEEAFAARVGAPVALALNSCTAGLHLALQVLGVGPGDEVIVPTLTFAASVNVIEHVGATPVFVDVRDDTLNVDPDAVGRAITERTRAAIIVHYGGHPAEMAPLQRLADERGFSLIEDAAHSLPASYRGKTIGNGRNLTAFSFYATKNLTTGEGGMLTGPIDLLERARVLSLHGMSGAAWGRYSGKGSWYYEVVEPGYKYNMTDVSAAIGLVQLRRLDEMQERRNEIVAKYLDGFSGIDGLRVPISLPHVESAWHLFPIRVSPGALPRDKLVEELGGRNIGTSVHFIPVHMHPFYAEKFGHSRGSFPVAEAAFEALVSLPLHPGLTDDDVSDVVAAVTHILRG